MDNDDSRTADEADDACDDDGRDGGVMDLIATVSQITELSAEIEFDGNEVPPVAALL